MTNLPAVKRFVSSTGVRIYRIPCDVLPGLTGRVYLLLGAGPVTLVDSGSAYEESIRQVLRGIEAVRSDFGEPVAVGDVGRVLITHGHVDHFGGLAEIVERTGAEVGVHRLDRRVIAAFDERAVVRRHALKRFLVEAGVPLERRGDLLKSPGYTKGLIRSVPIDFDLLDGMELDGLKFVHTPGHCPGHVCIAIGDVLLAGDHILARTIPQQWPESTGPFLGLNHYHESLEKVRRLEGIAISLGGHEPPVREIPERIDEIRDTHARRNARLLDILQKAPGPLTIDEMTTKMYSYQNGFFYMLAITDVGARVEYLDQQAQLAIANLDEVETQEHPVYRYEPAG